jgi:predicted nucleotidyltransferase
MATDDFDQEEAKKFLLERERKERDAREEDRQEVLQKVTSILREKFVRSSVEVYLVGSIIRPHAFSSRSDVDVVLKNFQGDRFELWSELETKFGRNVEIIPFETCSFQQFVLDEGLKVV